MNDISTKSPFIPQFAAKKSFDYKEAGWGLWFKIIVFLLLISLAGFGGSLFYKKILEKQIEELSFSLERAKASFDPVLIEEMDSLSKTMPVVKGLLVEHHYPSKIFELLEILTLPSVRFSDFSYTFEEGVQPVSRFAPSSQPAIENPVSISLEGEAESYTALAQQAEVFAKSTAIYSFAFSNFILTREGDVSFSLDVVLSSTIFEL